jgi:hypothetical protein
MIFITVGIIVFLILVTFTISCYRSYCHHKWEIVDRVDTNEKYLRCEHCGAIKEYKQRKE